MSRHQGYIPESIDQFAMKIVHRLHLDQGAMLGFIATVIREAVYEERKSVHMRETVGCFGCQTLMLRHEGLNERYCTRCPNCHEPMMTQAELYRKKYHLLEEKLKRE